MTTSASARPGWLGRPARWLAATGLLATMLLGALGSPSTAQSGPHGGHDGPPPDHGGHSGHEAPPPGPSAWFVLSLTPTGEVNNWPPSPQKVATLTCGPDGGSHPDPTEACDALRTVSGTFANLPDLGVGCPHVYDPHIAWAWGFWQQTPGGQVRFVNYPEWYSNTCFALNGTAGVFRF